MQGSPSTVDLDDPRTYSRIDAGNMRAQIREMGPQSRLAWQRGLDLPLPDDYASIDKVVILGMGGSAIGGDLVRAIAAGASRIQVYVARGYDLPSFVDARTLVIASSYSGDTEETLSAFGQALQTDARKLIITRGGRLCGIAEQRHIPMLEVRYEAYPRVALAHSLFPLLAIMQKLGLLSDLTKDVEEAAALLESLASELNEETPQERNRAKQLAKKLVGKLPVVYGAAFLEDVARRWKGQFAENAKTWSFFELLPELNHNSIAGYRFPVGLAERLHVLFLRATSLSPRLLARYDVTGELLTQAGVAHECVEARGESHLAQMMYLVLYGDYVSYYLAILNETDPSPVPAIGYLKQRLARPGQPPLQ